MDRITSSLITELLTNLEIRSDGEAKDFEKLVNYVVTSNEYNKTFDIDSLLVGDGNDTGIDGISIIVNGQLIESTDEVDDLLEKNNFLEVDYIFVQAKTSSYFDGGEINTFIFGVNDFFALEPRLVRNDEIIHFVEISNYIIDKAPKFRRNPSLKLFYVTTGNWTNDANLMGIIEAGKKSLEQSNLFNKVIFNIWGARELSTAYRKTKDTITSTINFSNRITIPQINGVSQAYIGLLPYSEFLKIVADEEGKLLNVFEDNVRDFQGENNDVNGGIANTLNNCDSEIFSVLNNGVTIVASSISPTGDQFTLCDYQIVNGCQTSNVLYNNQKGEYIKNVYVPIKLIATIDDEIKTRITLATNNQTPIKKEQLAALTKFQRNLEQYYNSFEGDSKLYYERRSKQYSSDSHITRSKIITVQYQIEYITPNVPLVSLTNVPDISLLNVPLFTGCN
ncbi:MAG: AIPR family protein [Macellibacteroides sp.]|uniref:AIPR family protein n=1 Tax=Macellibacteroides sp. TaxID=2014584 RepID=UPI003E748576